MEKPGALEKLSLLEERIAQTSERFAQLRNQFEAMQEQRTTLELEIERLRTANRELTDKIGDLRTRHEQLVGSFQKDDVKKRIDRVLEKLGELQL